MPEDARVLPSDAVPAIDLSTPGQRIHVVGVGGSGMSAIATVLAEMGHVVSGSDLRDSAGLTRLRAMGVSVQVGHDPANVEGVDAVALSSAIPPHNVEVIAARERGIPVLSRAEALRALTRLRSTIAVAGTHGKTTTSSMLTLILLDAGMQPSFVIGGDVNEIGTGAAWGTGDWFVVEADESDGTFVLLDRRAAIVTSVEADHLGFHGSVAALEESFEDFVTGTAGPVVVGIDDPGAARLAGHSGVVTYGASPDADYRLHDLVTERTTCRFSVTGRDGVLGSVRLAVPGAHNAQNALAALVMALEVGVGFERAVAGLARYAGVARRFEFRGEVAGVSFVDDYAHLPTEIEAALAAACGGGWDRVVCVFQPHRYSRTAELWPTFADAFGRADLLVVTDIYSAGETPRPGVTGKLIVDAVLDAHPWVDVAYLPRRDEVAGYLASTLRPGDLCLTLGAGDLTSLPDELTGRIGSRSA